MTISDPARIATPAPARWTGFLLARAHLRAHAMFQDALSPLALTPKSFGSLTVIAEQGPLSQAALGEMLRIDRTTVVAVVDELERAGYVERGRDSADRRVHSLRATGAGREALRAAERIADSMQAELLEDLDPDEREQLHSLLARIAG
ncbi:MAG TPA: MarR family transcriptional regulator [Solirubrobacteraceae bacterium]|jgi:MarR family transcriptional regulator, lower aerobic nicotinate degradation pathway regulator|nr:MarR family transcriptional regulator [Solirubrobacteraceae bacterium]